MITVNKTLKLPEMFRIACKIHNLSHTELLQAFIDHVSMYDYLAPPSLKLHSIAGQVVNAYCHYIKPKPANKKEYEIARKYVDRHIEVIGSELSEKEKRRKCRLLTDSWCKAIKLPETKTTELQLNEEVILSLNKDLRLLCRLFYFDPAQLLYYVMERISLPRLKAQSIVKSRVNDPVLGLFIRLIDKFNRQKKDEYLPAQDIYKKYLEELRKLDSKLMIEPNGRKREEAYAKLYRAWYRELSAVSD